MYLPIGLFGVSIATAVLPMVSQHAAVNDDEGIRETVSRGIGLMLMFNVPATLGLLALATPIVQLLFERGRFLPADTAATASALRLYAIGLAGYSTARIASPTFYALRQSRLPVIVSTCTIGVNLVVSVVLVRLIGFRGLALGTSLAALVNGGVLLLMLRRRLGGIDGAALAVSLFKVTTASGVMALATLGIDHGAAAIVTGRGVSAQLFRLGLAIAGGLVTLAGCAKVLKIREFDAAWALVRLRFSSGGR
jgi:putative peptidoglycan lipid II flippase